MKVSVTQYGKTVTVEHANEDMSIDEAVDLARDAFVGIGFDPASVDEALDGGNSSNIVASGEIDTPSERDAALLEQLLDRIKTVLADELTGQRLNDRMEDHTNGSGEGPGEGMTDLDAVCEDIIDAILEHLNVGEV